MGLALKTGDIVFLDTAPFIYFFEQHPNYFAPLDSLFDQLYATGAQAITSMITYIELTTHPARLCQTKLVRKYRDHLSHSENISPFQLDMKIADQAVRLRARYQFKTPDAFQLGTAVACGADYVITNDIAWQQFTEVRVLLVEDLWPVQGSLC